MAQHIGEHVRARRLACGWSLRDLARQSGVNRATLSRIENGHEFTLTQLIRLADAFGIGAGDLLTDAGYTTRNGNEKG